MLDISSVDSIENSLNGTKDIREEIKAYFERAMTLNLLNADNMLEIDGYLLAYNAETDELEAYAMDFDKIELFEDDTKFIMPGYVDVLNIDLSVYVKSSMTKVERSRRIYEVDLSNVKKLSGDSIRMFFEGAKVLRANKLLEISAGTLSFTNFTEVYVNSLTSLEGFLNMHTVKILSAKSLTKLDLSIYAFDNLQELYLGSTFKTIAISRWDTDVEIYYDGTREDYKNLNHRKNEYLGSYQVFEKVHCLLDVHNNITDVKSGQELYDKIVSKVSQLGDRLSGYSFGFIKTNIRDAKEYVIEHSEDLRVKAYMDKYFYWNKGTGGIGCFSCSLDKLNIRYEDFFRQICCYIYESDSESLNKLIDWLNY